MDAVVSVGFMSIGFVANATPTPHVVQGIRYIMTITPAAAIFYFGYKLEDKQVAIMQQEMGGNRILADS